MTDVALDNTGDIDVSLGEVRLTSGQQSIEQHLKSRLKTFLGEWFLDERVGVPYYEKVFDRKHPDIQIIKSVFTREILKTPGVSEITDISLQIDTGTRELLVGVSVKSKEGAFTLTLEV
jgi:hypothetical protein